MSPYFSTNLLSTSYSKPYVRIEELDNDNSVVSRKLYSYSRAATPALYDYGTRTSSDWLSPYYSRPTRYYDSSLTSLYPYHSSSLSPYYSSYSSWFPSAYRTHYSYSYRLPTYHHYEPIVQKHYHRRYYCPNYTYIAPTPPPVKYEPPINHYHYHSPPPTTRTTTTRSIRSYSVPPIEYRSYSVPRVINYGYLV